MATFTTPPVRSMRMTRRLAALAAAAVLTAVYVVPPVAALGGSRAGLAGYLAGVAGRVVSAASSGSRGWPDALAHPLSVLVLDVLVLRSVQGRRRGTLRWRGRTVTAAPDALPPVASATMAR